MLQKIQADCIHLLTYITNSTCFCCLLLICSQGLAIIWLWFPAPLSRLTWKEMYKIQSKQTKHLKISVHITFRANHSMKSNALCIVILVRLWLLLKNVTESLIGAEENSTHLPLLNLHPLLVFCWYFWVERADLCLLGEVQPFAALAGSGEEMSLAGTAQCIGCRVAEAVKQRGRDMWTSWSANKCGAAGYSGSGTLNDTNYTARIWMSTWMWQACHWLLCIILFSILQLHFVWWFYVNWCTFHRK